MIKKKSLRSYIQELYIKNILIFYKRPTRYYTLWAYLHDSCFVIFLKFSKFPPIKNFQLKCEARSKLLACVVLQVFKGRYFKNYSFKHHFPEVVCGALVGRHPAACPLPMLWVRAWSSGSTAPDTKKPLCLSTVQLSPANW